MFNIFFFPENPTVCEVKWRRMVESDGPQNMVRELRMLNN